MVNYVEKQEYFSRVFQFRKGGMNKGNIKRSFEGPALKLVKERIIINVLLQNHQILQMDQVVRFKML